MNGRMQSNKIADAGYQQTLDQRGVRINGQAARQLAVFDIQDFLCQGIEGMI
ncbi:hypothetical protein D3C71_1942190 [compost metagenome]